MPFEEGKQLILCSSEIIIIYQMLLLLLLLQKEYNLYRVVTINPVDIGGGYFSSSSSALRNLQNFLLHSTKYFIWPR